MPAIRTWTGASDGTTWATAGNWNPSDSYPVTGDTAILGDTTDAIAGSDQSAQTLDFLYTTNQFRGTLGSSGVPMTIGCYETYLRGSSNSMWLNLSSSLYTVIAVNSTAANACVLGGALGGIVWVNAGRVTVASGTTIGATIHTGTDPAASVGPWLTVSSGVSFPGTGLTFVCNEGLFNLAKELSASGTIVVSGGKFTYTGGNLPASTNIQVLGGVFQWDSGDVGDFYISGSGFLDGTRSQTARTATLVVAADSAKADLRTGSGAITTTTVREFGGAVVHRDGA